MQEIGLFPLGMVLLPNERVPLHIFEERYKELVRECLDAEQPFGLILVEDDEVAGVGTLAHVAELTRQFPDGRMNIVIEGAQRFRVIETTSGRSFATAQIHLFEDDGADATAEEIDELLEAFADLAKAAEAETPTVTAEAATLSFQLAALVELENGPRQELLEIDSEGARTRYLTSLFGELAASIRRQAQVRGRAESNGRVDSRG
ncbi:MAG: LON peptidase substrate-binding domain-containing protein [Gaiellaceae bacterium]